MSQPRRQVCLNITEVEFHSIRALFSHSEWDFDSCVVFNNWKKENTDEEIRAGQNVSATSDNNPDINEQQAAGGDPGHGGDDAMPEINDQECMYCFCHPCVTSNRQEWLGNGAPPHTRNSTIRKTKYKKFWTMMSRRYAWNHPRYQAKKAAHFNRDEEVENIVWTQREIMPECVLSLVRDLYPNPPGRPYMGHKWA